MALTWHDNKQVVLLKLCINSAHLNCVLNAPSHPLLSLSSLLYGLSVSVFLFFYNSQRGSLHVDPKVYSLHP